MININKLIELYKKDTEFDIENSLGNCSFFTKDVINWAKKNGIKADYVYMPMSEEYRKRNKIGKKFGGNDSDWEDHIVPMINGYLIDFTYTPNGVSHKVRKTNTLNPEPIKLSDSLFKPNGMYGKFGYTSYEINSEYGNPKNINTFDVTEPNKKTMKMNEDKIKGGKADKLTKKDIVNKFDITSDEIEEELKMGEEVELEHTGSEDLAKEIAMDHLSEFPDYYTRLKKMEKTAEKYWKKREKTINESMKDYISSLLRMNLK